MNITVATELYKVLAEETGLKQGEIKDVFVAYGSLIAKMAKEDDKILLPSLGNFTIITRAEKNGVNPNTGDKILIPKRLAYKFKFGGVKNKFKVV